MDNVQRSTDAELMAAWQQGGPAAFEALVRRWQQPIGRFLARLLGRPELVADLCQEVFLRVYLAGRRYRQTGSFSTWLYRIALNVARDASRHIHPGPVLEQEPLDPEPPADAVCVRQKTVQAVAQAVASSWPEVRISSRACGTSRPASCK